MNIRTTFTWATPIHIQKEITEEQFLWYPNPFLEIIENHNLYYYLHSLLSCTFIGRGFNFLE
jgi:hypothetical protein